MAFKPVTARAHTNIALIKYWGKKDSKEMLPMNSSLSLTLDHFFTETQVGFDPALTQDVFYLNKQVLPVSSKVQRVMNEVRHQAGINTAAKIVSTNHVPTTAGLASSASAFAALAGAASRAAGLKLKPRDLSRLARKGSGSATRSIFGGFVEWHQGHDDLSSYAEQIAPTENWDIRVIAVVIDASQKKISSSQGMARAVNTSPYYPAWIQTATKQLKEIKQAIKEKDFTSLGQISELNALEMHVLNLSSTPHFSYFEPTTISIMNLVERLRARGIECYYTIDAGPNVKIICQEKSSLQVQKAVKKEIPNCQVLESQPGPGIQFIN